MKAIFLALWPTILLIIGIIIGRLTGKLDGQLIYLNRIRDALREVNRFRPKNEADLKYYEGYFHGICHVSEGRPPDRFRVDDQIRGLEP
jgi:hypothetical protein